MDEKKQIDEREKIISDICPFYKEYGSCDRCNTELNTEDPPCYFECMANAIINNGYRNQSEGERVETDYKTLEHGFVERRGKEWKCANCLHASKRFDNHMNFCPNCGAKMKGGEQP